MAVVVGGAVVVVVGVGIVIFGDVEATLIVRGEEVDTLSEEERRKLKD